MADFTIQGAIGAIEKLGERIAYAGENIMVSEVPVRSGSLQQSIHHEQTGSSTWFVGTDVFYAYYVENGRGVVKPVRKKVLHWIDGGDVFAKRAGPAKANDFVGRTAAKLNAMSFSL